jgi:hypothetical protein
VGAGEAGAEIEGEGGREEGEMFLGGRQRDRDQRDDLEINEIDTGARLQSSCRG